MNGGELMTSKSKDGTAADAISEGPPSPNHGPSGDDPAQEAWDKSVAGLSEANMKAFVAALVAMKPASGTLSATAEEDPEDIPIDDGPRYNSHPMRQPRRKP